MKRLITTLFIAAAAAQLAGCTAGYEQSQRQELHVDCIAQAKGDRDKFNWCYDHQRANLIEAQKWSNNTRVDVAQKELLLLEAQKIAFDNKY